MTGPINSLNIVTRAQNALNEVANPPVTVPAGSRVEISQKTLAWTMYDRNGLITLTGQLAAGGTQSFLGDAGGETRATSTYAGVGILRLEEDGVDPSVPTTTDPPQDSGESPDVVVTDKDEGPQDPHVEEETSATTPDPPAMDVLSLISAGILGGSIAAVPEQSAFAPSATTPDPPAQQEV